MLLEFSGRDRLAAARTAVDGVALDLPKTLGTSLTVLAC
jgi:hypothetical protein